MKSFIARLFANAGHTAEFFILKMYHTPTALIDHSQQRLLFIITTMVQIRCLAEETKIMLKDIPTKQSLAQTIENLVSKEGMSYIEAALHYCAELQIDPLDVGKLISPVIKSKIEAEAMTRNLLPKSNSLDSFM